MAAGDGKAGRQRLCVSACHCTPGISVPTSAPVNHQLTVQVSPDDLVLCIPAMRATEIMHMVKLILKCQLFNNTHGRTRMF